MQVQTIDKVDIIDKDLNELMLVDRVHDELVQLLDKVLVFLDKIEKKK